MGCRFQTAFLLFDTAKEKNKMTDTLLTIALSKGRIFEETLPLLAAAGIVPAEEPENRAS